ncbi:integrase catalytic domain-containing protein [Trichonephila clavipes]|nr:integrase catalytic domain-containing protein [Trichonephila clavipes]
MVTVYAEKCVSEKSVRKWSARFRAGRESVGDDQRPGQANIVITSNLIDKVDDLVRSDRRVTLRMKVDVSYGTVWTIVHDRLRFRKVRAAWVPKQLTDQQKELCMGQALQHLFWYQEDPAFMKRIVTGKDTWCHLYEPETKQDRMQWKHTSSPPPKKFRAVKSAGKVHQEQKTGAAPGVVLLHDNAASTRLQSHTNGTGQVQMGDVGPSALQSGHVALQFPCVWSTEETPEREALQLGRRTQEHCEGLCLVTATGILGTRNPAACSSMGASPLEGQELNPNAEEFHSSQENTAASLSCINSRSKTVILPTAVVWVLNHSTGSCIQARVVLDSGSMSNIITQDFANQLGAPQNRVNFPISSLDGNKTTKLVDPDFGVPGEINLLIGAEAFFDIIKEEIIRISDNELVFRRSVFGYIATGTTHSYKQNQYCDFISEMQNIDDNLQKFWEIKTINEGQKPLSKEEEYCENLYQMTHTSNEAVRYVVQMSVKDIQGLEHLKCLAMKRLDQLWGRLSKDKPMRNLYSEFMQQYLDLGHIEKVEEHSDEASVNNIWYYLSHHGAFRPDKTTTKLRVVFNMVQLLLLQV